MKFTNFLTKQYLLSFSILVFLTILIIPFPTESVPAWQVLVIDENYLPGANKTLEQRVGQANSEDISVYKGTTDENGFVVFPKRFLWSSISARTFNFLAGLLGRDTQTIVQINVADGKCRDGKIIWESRNDEGKPLPDKLVCP